MISNTEYILRYTTYYVKETNYTVRGHSRSCRLSLSTKKHQSTNRMFIIKALIKLYLRKIYLKMFYEQYSCNENISKPHVSFSRSVMKRYKFVNLSYIILNGMLWKLLNQLNPIHHLQLDHSFNPFNFQVTTFIEIPTRTRAYIIVKFCVRLEISEIRFLL